MKKHRRQHTGFTIVEALIAIGIIGVLVAIIAPALSGVRGAARGVVCLSNLRQAAGTIIAATTADSGRYPFAPAGTPIPASPDGASSVASSQHWDLAWQWTGLVIEQAPWREHFPAWVCPGSQRPPGRPWVSEVNGSEVFGVPSYVYSNSFVARPNLWRQGSVEDPAHLAPTRLHETAHPALKALLFDAEMAHAPNGESDAQPVAFADEHAELKRLADATEPATNPMRDGASLRLHDTAGGVTGRDY